MKHQWYHMIHEGHISLPPKKGDVVFADEIKTRDIDPAEWEKVDREIYDREPSSLFYK